MFFFPCYLVYNDIIIRSLPGRYDRPNVFTYIAVSGFHRLNTRIKKLERRWKEAVVAHLRLTGGTNKPHEGYG
jgi:hypothetical protein